MRRTIWNAYKKTLVNSLQQTSLMFCVQCFLLKDLEVGYPCVDQRRQKPKNNSLKENCNLSANNFLIKESSIGLGQLWESRNVALSLTSWLCSLRDWPPRRQRGVFLSFFSFFLFFLKDGFTAGSLFAVVWGAGICRYPGKGKQFFNFSMKPLLPFLNTKCPVYERTG